MIQESETGLTHQQYLDVQEATGDLSATITLQRYGPVWFSHDASPARAGDNFDACIAGAFLVRVYLVGVSDIEVERLPDESGGDEAWVSCNLVPEVGNFDMDVPPSIISDGLTVRVFYYTADGKIKYTESPDISNSSFAIPVEVSAAADVIYLAATSLDKCHYITKNVHNNRIFHYVDAVSDIDSDVYWPFRIRALDAVTVGNKDLLMIGGDLPPLLGSRAIGAEVTTTVEAVEGITAFWETNDRWSDYRPTDIIDRVEISSSRSDLKLSYTNNILFASYKRVGGDGDYTYTKMAISRSKDGENWEFPEFISVVSAVDPDVSTPGIILPRTDYLYVVGVDETLRSPCCAWAGQTPEEQTITDNVLGLESSAAEIRNSAMRIANPGDSLAGTLAKSDARIQAKYDLGYVVGGDALRVTVSTEDIISRQDRETLPRDELALSTKDFLGRANRIRSDYAAEWPGLQAGHDDYDDPSGTGYGGLRHTAPYDGYWKTPSESIGELHLISSNKEGIAISTFVADALNGSAQTAFKLHTLGQGEYAGIAFRIFDKDNLFFVAYYLDDDVIKLVKGKGDEDEGRKDTVVATSGAMSWVKETWYWLKVVVRYSLVYVYTSIDGITWTAVTWSGGGTAPIELEGEPSYSVMLLSGINAWSGRFGLIGYGYSEEDEWEPYVPEPWPPLTPPLPAAPKVVFLQSHQRIARTGNFDEDFPNWTAIFDVGTWSILDFVLDYSDERHAYALVTDNGNRYLIYKCENILATVPTWSTIWDTASGYTPLSLARGANGALEALDAMARHDLDPVKTNNRIYRTIDYGINWSYTPTAQYTVVSHTRGVPRIFTSLTGPSGNTGGIAHCGGGGTFHLLDCRGGHWFDCNYSYMGSGALNPYIVTDTFKVYLDWNGGLLDDLADDCSGQAGTATSWTPFVICDTRSALGDRMGLGPITYVRKSGDGTRSLMWLTGDTINDANHVTLVQDCRSIFGYGFGGGNSSDAGERTGWGDYYSQAWVAGWQEQNPSGNRIVYWTTDLWQTYVNKTGDYLSAIGYWQGWDGSGGDRGNARVCFFYGDVEIG